MGKGKYYYLLSIVHDKAISNAKRRKMKQSERGIRWHEIQTKLVKVLERRFVRKRCEEIDEKPGGKCKGKCKQIDGKPKRFKKWVLWSGQLQNQCSDRLQSEM